MSSSEFRRIKAKAEKFGFSLKCIEDAYLQERYFLSEDKQEVYASYNIYVIDAWMNGYLHDKHL